MSGRKEGRSLCGQRGLSVVSTRGTALMAHDNKKVDFVAWATFNRETLAQFDLIATRHTARLVHI